MKKLIITVAIVLVAVIISAWYFSYNSPPKSSTSPTPSASVAEHSISDGKVTVSFDSSQFGLATTTDQVLVKAYIPPCSQSFDYCLYYIGDAYTNTNFESAGLSIQKRIDLTTQSKCLNTLPDGYSNMTPVTASGNGYMTSEFSPLGDAAAGHFSVGALYRLSFAGNCYEFQTRVGQTQFQNYPAGSIQEFTAADETSLDDQLAGILNGIKLDNGEQVSFPQK